MISGYATLQGTTDYFKKRNLWGGCLRNILCGITGPIAMGNHLGDFSDLDSQSYRNAMQYGLDNGINFIDTAINYRGMRSEIDTGRALEKAIIDKIISREEVIISTKGGLYLGDITRGLRPEEYFKKVLEPKGITKEDFNYEELYGAHTLEPEFYEHALHRSMENLGVETIDIYYIHLPEVSRKVIGTDLFCKKLELLFYYLELQVNCGNIRYYGLATEEAFTYDQNSDWFFSLEKVVGLAEKVAGYNNHFKFLQAPYNIHNQSISKIKSQLINGQMYTTIEACQRLNLILMANMPLAEGRLLKSQAIKDALNFVINTSGIMVTMIGSKNIEHIKENINTSKELSKNN